MDTENIFLTRKQALRLQDLGFDMSQSPFFWGRIVRDRYGNRCKGSWHIYDHIPPINDIQDIEIIPTLSFAELFSMLPDTVKMGPVDFKLAMYKEYLCYEHQDLRIWCMAQDSYPSRAYDMLLFLTKRGDCKHLIKQK